MELFDTTRRKQFMDMKTRKDAGLPYIADETLLEQMGKNRKLLQKFNTADLSDYPLLAELLQQILGRSDNAFINPPFYCDYGTNIEVGKNFFANYNCTILDVAKVTIGDYVLFGPNVSVYTAGHPLHPDTRRSGYEYGIPVTIGDNCWIGGGVIICPGVHIGNNCVVGAGSIVTKDLPDNAIAAGNPCKVLRYITEEDREYYFKDRKFDTESWEDLTARGFGPKKQ